MRLTKYLRVTTHRFLFNHAKKLIGSNNRRSYDLNKVKPEQQHGQLELGCLICASPHGC